MPPASDGSAPNDSVSHALFEDASPPWEYHPTVVRALGDAMAVTREPANVADALARVRAKRSHVARRSLGWQGAGGRVATRRVTIGALAGAVLLALIIVAGPRIRSAMQPHDAAAAQTYTTAAGQYTTVTLANGARVAMGPATTIAVSTSATEQGTTVRMTGQALFTVTHTNRAPFVVHAGHTLTRVLGTTFMVRRYASDTAVQVVVADGRVALESLRDANANVSRTVLSANTLGIADDSGHIRVIPNTPAEDYTAWVTGQLVFRKTPMRDIVVELGRAYGANIRLGDSTLAARTFTWTVPVARQSLSSVLEAITTALDAHFTRSDSIITILPGPAASRRPDHPLTADIPESQYGR